MGLSRFKIPNQVIAELYWQYYVTVLQIYAGIETEEYEFQKVVHDMATDGKYEPFFKVIEELLQGLSNRDYIQFSEKYVKMIIIAYMQLANLFEVRSEREVKNLGYIDLELLKSMQNPFEHIEYAMEIKYLKKANKAQLAQTQQEASEQLLNYYKNDPELQKKPQLMLLTVVVVKNKVYIQKLSV